MNNLPPNTNLVTLSTEWDMMEDYESRNRLRSTSNNNTQEPTTRFHARALPQNTMGDGMNNPHEAVSIANLNINYNRLGGPPDRFTLDKLHLPTPPDNCEGKARDSANSHSHSVANLETNGEFLDSLSKSMENLSTNETTLTGSIPRLSSTTNGRSPAMGVPYPYASMQSPLTNGPMNETNAMFPSNATFRDHKNGEPDSEMRHYYPYGYTGSYPISTPSRGQPPQPFPGSMGNAYTDNGSTLGTAQNSSNNNKGYSYINGQTNSQKYAAQSATTFSLGEPEASEPPQHISNAIVIKNIPFGVKIEQLKRLMEDLKLPTPYAFNYHFDKENLFRGLAFANFHHDWEATEVIKVLNGYVISERALRVELKIMLKPGERETAEREKRMKRGQLQEQHKPVSPDMIESLPRLFNPESPIPAPVCSYTSGGQQQHDIPRQRRLPASVFDYTTSGDDRQTSATCPQRQAPQRQPNGPSSYPGSQSPSWRPIREQPRPTGQYPRAGSSQYGFIGDRMIRPLGGTGPSQVATATNPNSGPSFQQTRTNNTHNPLVGTRRTRITPAFEYDNPPAGSSGTQRGDYETI